MSFLERVRKTDLKKAGYIALGMGVFNICLHGAVLTRVLPYTWVNGGRTENFTMACQISVVSVVITVMHMLIVLVASEMIPVRWNRFWGIAMSVFLIATLPFDVIGIVQQFLGTPFEKCVTSIVTIVVFLTDFRIAVEKRWSE